MISQRRETGKPSANGTARRRKADPSAADDAEEFVAGCTLLGPADVDRVVRLVALEHFRVYPCRLVVEAAIAVRDAGLNVNRRTVLAWIRDNADPADLGPAPRAYLDRLHDAAGVGAGVEHEAGRVRTAAGWRKLVGYAAELGRDAADGIESPADLAARFTGRLAEVTAEPGAARRRFELVDAETFFGADYRLEWIVPGLLVRGEPGFIAGQSKTLKTSILLDLALSAATARPFLGHFPIPKRVKVCIASGESGKRTLQETAKRIIAARGIDKADLKGWFNICFTLPTLSNAADVVEFERQLRRVEADLVGIDPLYLCLGADVDERSMFRTGPALRSIIEQTDRTYLFAHHANGRVQTGKPMGLEHLAYSGFAQFARQWLLLSREKEYQMDGVHDLLLSAGGSAGQGGLWAAHIREGVTDHEFKGRAWDVSVQTMTEARNDQAAERDSAKRQANRGRIVADEAEVLRAIELEAAAGHEGATVKSIRVHTGFTDKKAKDVLQGLVEDGAVEPVEFKKTVGNGAQVPRNGFRRTTKQDMGNMRKNTCSDPLFGNIGNMG